MSRRKRKGVGAAGRPGAGGSRPGDDLVKLNLSLPRSVRVRLGAYAEFRERTMSDLVAEWAVAAMRGFSVSQRPEAGERSSGDQLPEGDGGGLRAVG